MKKEGDKEREGGNRDRRREGWNSRRKREGERDQLGGD